MDIIKNCSPTFFEKLVIDLLIAIGYSGSRKDAGEAMGKSGDGGIDGIIKEDKLGFDIIYLQAKRWENSVPVKEIRDFTGALASKKAKKGIFITTSSFPKSVYEFVNQVEYKIILIDGHFDDASVFPSAENWTQSGQGQLWLRASLVVAEVDA